MEFSCNFAENAAKRSKTMAAVTYLFGFSSYGVERNCGGKKTVCYMRVSNDIRFEQSIESQISLHSNYRSFVKNFSIIVGVMLYCLSF